MREFVNKITHSNISYTLRHGLCTGCGICQSACPSNAINITVKQGRFIPQVDDTKCKNDKGCHRCSDVCPGLGVDLHRYDIRYHCASGGMVSQFLIFLLEKGYIDGAVVTAFDPKNELLVRSYIAHNREEVLQAKSSKYAPVSLHGMAQSIKQETGTRYVIVGLPCHIQGFRKLAEIDRKFRDVQRTEYPKRRLDVFRLSRRRMSGFSRCAATTRYQGS